MSGVVTAALDAGSGGKRFHKRRDRWRSPPSAAAANVSTMIRPQTRINPLCLSEREEQAREV